MDQKQSTLKNDVTLVMRRAQALNERLRTMLRTITAIERDDTELAAELRHYGIISEFAEIATGIGDLDTAVAALVRRLGFE
jgi:hypothetical protein